MTKEQLQDLDAMAKPRSDEAVKKAEERKKQREDKDLLLRDLCGRLPYGVKVTFAGYSGRDDCILNSQHLNSTYAIEYLRLKPYLRPMSSMTKEEQKELRVKNIIIGVSTSGTIETTIQGMDWLNAHHFDYRRLIEKGLAISTNVFNPYKD